MPTGYTAGVADGSITTLRQYALLCARGMGACIMMRDEPFSAAIPERFEPSTKYYDERIAEATKALSELPALTAGECEVRAAAEYDEQLVRHYQYTTEMAAENRRYMRMLDAVRDWSTEAEGIRDFMQEQLRISVRDYQPQAPVKQSGAAWLVAKLHDAADELTRATKSRAEEIERTESRNQWLAALRASLPDEVQP